MQLIKRIKKLHNWGLSPFFLISIIGLACPVVFLLGSQKVFSDNNPKPPEVEQFSEFRKNREKLPKRDNVITLIAVGDVMLSRGVAKKMKANGFDYPFAKTGEYLKTGDIVFGNLESPIVKGRQIHSLEMIFRAEPGVEIALRNSGFNILSLANNHIPNFGENGINSTIGLLDKAGIKHTGAGANIDDANRPAIIECKGMIFAFLAYNDTDVVPDSYEAAENHHGTNIMNIDKMTTSVANAKKNADFVIVSMHSGYEYKPTPNQSQVNFAHAAIDSGADLVIGHHPHVVQTAEKYKGKYIFYSLGNFIFDQMWSQETREGLVAKFFITKDGVQKIEFMTVLSEDYSQPRFIFDEPSDKILQRLQMDLTERKVFYWDKNDAIFREKSRKAIYESQEKGLSKREKSISRDVNSDGFSEQYFLKNGSLYIIQNEKTFWKTPDNWWVDDFFLADSTHDGTTEINMSVWRAGNFGSSKPFWIEENDMSIKNHLFVFNLAGSRVQAKWMSSNLPQPNIEFCFDDIDSDGRQELISIDGSYSDENSIYGNYVSVWRWESWGFFLEWRSDEGKFINLEVQQIENMKYIIVDSF